MKRYYSLLLLVILVMVSGCGIQLGKQAEVPRSKLSLHDLIAQEGGVTVALMMYKDKNETTQTTGYRPFCTGVWVDETHIVTADHCVKAELDHQQDRLDERKQKDKEEPKTIQSLFARLFGGSMENTEDDKIEEKGLVVHFIQENEVIEVGKEPSAWHMSRVLAYDEKHDLALLEATGKELAGHRIAKLADTTPEVGEHLNIVGHTTGMFWTYIQGNVSAYRGEDFVKTKKDKTDAGPWMQVASPMFFGNSGGGAFNDNGELVGIADWMKRAPEMGFFIHLDTIKSFLSSSLKK
jgi:Trypsin-like peptidase domain